MESLFVIAVPAIILVDGVFLALSLSGSGESTQRCIVFFWMEREIRKQETNQQGLR